MDESRTVNCPICGKEVDTLRARAVGIYAGRTQYFCSADCKAQYADPRKSPREPKAEEGAPAAPAPEPARVAKDAPHKLAREARKHEAEAEPERVRHDEPEADAAGPSKKVKKDPSPSIMEDAEAWKGGGSKVWLVVLMLFATAAVVLYFAFVKK